MVVAHVGAEYKLTIIVVGKTRRISRFFYPITMNGHVYVSNKITTHLDSHLLCSFFYLMRDRAVKAGDRRRTRGRWAVAAGTRGQRGEVSDMGKTGGATTTDKQGRSCVR
jgi:hypothetical protein